MNTEINRSALNLRTFGIKRFSIAVTVVVSLLTVSAGFAADVYKYKNSDGVWVFTDEKPEGDKYTKDKLLFTQPQAKVAVVNRGSKERPILYAVSKVYGPVEVWLDFTQSKNVKFSQKEPFYWVVSGPGEELLLEMEADKADEEWSYGWRATFVPGAPVTQTSINKSPLGLPTKGGPFVITQAFHGEDSHKQHVEAVYAVDVAAPENTPVIAVKAGVVMDTDKDFSRAGWSADYADEANMVRVLHSDGSMGLYAHFRVDGIVATPGQKVKKGQLLGYSGSTGFSSGPHLHFALQINSGKKLVSVPFVFEGYTQAPKKGDIIGPN